MSYRNINNLYKDQSILFFKECYASEKLHGCVSEDTLLQTESDLKKIKDIIIDDNVLTLNHETNQIEYCSVLNVFVYENNDDWYEITTENDEKILITGDHRVWLPKLSCYRKVKNLDTNDFLLIKK